MVLGGGPPIDGGRKLSDGNRILGGGKTVRGFFAGILAGSVLGVIQGVLGGRPGGWEAAVLMSLGALLGDVVGSFIKRRMALKRGRPVPGLDQLEFVVGALLLSSVIWLPSLEIIVVLVLVTPLFHLGTNFVGYKLGYKSEPY